MRLKLYNTLTRKKEAFRPLKGNTVRMYSCGPTVYDYPHIGNLRSYIFVDTLKRTLLFNGYKIKHVVNITDVGHLISDADEGEDKLETGAKREKKTVWEIAQFYTDIFKENLKELNILEPTIWAKATDHIKEQIELIKRLEKKGYAYQTSQAVYFDIPKFPHYTKLSGQKLEEKIVGARPEVELDAQKRNPQDFALWFKRVGRFKDHTMHWDSPWGDGFPGWHIECSAMSMKYLGESFDIHTGGVDHITIHHTNEIAQSEGATGKQFVRFWMHGEFLLVEGKKMAKSAGTFITLEDIKKQGFNPLAFRLLVLQSHYRAKLNFSWDSLYSSQEALEKVENAVKNLGIAKRVGSDKKPLHPSLSHILGRFKEAINDDLNTPRALALFFDLLGQAKNQKFDQRELSRVVLSLDRVLGLRLASIKKPEMLRIGDVTLINQTDKLLSLRILNIIKARQQQREVGNWQEADRLRSKIESLGYVIEDREGEIVIKSKI